MNQSGGGELFGWARAELDALKKPACISHGKCIGPCRNVATISLNGVTIISDGRHLIFAREKSEPEG